MKIPVSYWENVPGKLVLFIDYPQYERFNRRDQKVLLGKSVFNLHIMSYPVVNEPGVTYYVHPKRTKEDWSSLEDRTGPVTYAKAQVYMADNRKKYLRRFNFNV